MSRAANSDEVGMSGRGPVGDEDISDRIDEVGEVSTPSRDDARLERTMSLPKSILGETIRGAGQGASPWKSVKFEEELPEGFPERTANGFKRKNPARGGEVKGINLLFIVLGCVWLSRVFHILTQRFTSTLADRREEF
jgi:hypothetical protein|tara:strand:+ start:4001 stop:4414 length:414 start_codon:yes stop_codon:yes gene_type:complete